MEVKGTEEEGRRPRMSQMKPDVVLFNLFQLDDLRGRHLAQPGLPSASFIYYLKHNVSKIIGPFIKDTSTREKNDLHGK